MDTEVVEPVVDTPAPPEAETKTGEVEQAASTPATGDTPAEQPKKKSGGFQKRIDRLTRQVYEQQAQIQLLSAGKSPPTDKEPQRGDFEDLESFNKALATHIAKQTVRETLEAEKKTQQEATKRQDQAKRAETWESHVERVSDKYEDGEDVVANFLHVELSHIALDAIIESELCGELAYFLGKNEAEAERISKLNPARQASEIGKLEAKLASQPTKKASSAPPPINPVAGKSGSDAGLSDDLSTAEWIKRRQKQVHGKN